ncbi:histone RNA hairpin-binding protein [Onthophagus taurus]|uniref:histone RNA hairpin-binding protein n=1 Tax=Onthophagus taurus TaxID=166361 RepID=UPI000C1FE30D|nr:histone RNA hairpin-binding protein [Onthophagus taurus]
MTSEYRRFSVNTSLRDANIFEDSSSADDTLHIKEEPLDDYPETNTELYNENCRLSKDKSFTSLVKEEFSLLSTDSPIKQERIDFEKKLTFDSEDNTNEPECPPPPSISSNDIKKEMVCPTAPIISVKRNLLKRKNESSKRTASECDSEIGVSPVKRAHVEKHTTISKRQIESDPEVLRRRQKQIDYGKNTIGYERYITEIPKHSRGQNDPQTPDKHRKYSRRGWDGLIKQWRLRLHRFDPSDDEDDDEDDEIKKEKIDIKEEND